MVVWMGRPQVLIVQHTATGGPRRLGDWLLEEGLDLDVATPYDGTPLPDLLSHDAIVVLGGGFMPDDDMRAPWLPQTRMLVRQALDHPVPVLGICLGGQLLAHVAGGTVRSNAGAPEHGSTPIRLRSAAGRDPLLRDLPPVVPAIEHHVDAITRLPPAAIWLASSDRCRYQAFRVGPVAWGVQFHPEVGAERIRHWDADRLRRQGFDRDRLYAQAQAEEPTSAEHWRAVIGRFAAQIRRSG